MSQLKQPVDVPSNNHYSKNWVPSTEKKPKKWKLVPLIKFEEDDGQEMLTIKPLQLPNFKPKVKRPKLYAPIAPI